MEAVPPSHGVGEEMAASLFPPITRLDPTAPADLADHSAARAERRRERWRRWLNVGVAAVALVALSPLLALVALLVRLTSPGPILYTQTRIGHDRRRVRNDGGDEMRSVDLGGRPFRIYKFRTMRSDASSEDQVWCLRDDPRITRVGQWLRKYRLDELPQLINVMRGDMNVVGPRPEQPLIFRRLRDQVDGYARRQRVLPGITGWAQVNQHYDQTIEDVRRKVGLDLEYIESRSVWTDLRIMLRTVPVMLFQRGGW